MRYVRPVTYASGQCVRLLEGALAGQTAVVDRPVEAGPHRYWCICEDGTRRIYAADELELMDAPAD